MRGRSRFLQCVHANLRWRGPRDTTSIFAYFLNLKSGSRRGAAALSPTSGEAIHTPIREFAKGLACIVAGAIGVVVGLRVPDVQLGVAIALTAAVVAIVAFMLFLLRTLHAWQSGKVRVD